MRAIKEPCSPRLGKFSSLARMEEVNPLHSTFRRCRLLGAGLLLVSASALRAQEPAPTPGEGHLSKVSVTGTERFSQEAILTAIGLSAGQSITRLQMQVAADHLSAMGVFQNVRYNFRSQKDQVELVFQVEDAELLPVFFDNFPWFTDDELSAAIRAATPFYAGALPAAGSVLEAATTALQKLLPERKVSGQIRRERVGQIHTDGMMLRFSIDGPALKIGAIEFEDPIAAADAALRALAQDLVGKKYSRMAVEIFVREQVRPLYLQRGHLRALYNRPKARFTGDPNKPLADNVLVLIPIVPGPVFRWGGVTWAGNAAFGAKALDAYVAFPAGETVNGVSVENLWETIQSEYGRLGYLEAKLLPLPRYDESQLKVNYEVRISEGPVYRMGELVITGLSPLAKRKIQEAWTLEKGAVFNSKYFEEFLASCESKKIFGDYVVHYDEVGYLLDRKPENHSVNVLLDFK